MLPTFASPVSQCRGTPAENSCVKVEALTLTSEAGSALRPLFLGGGTNFHTHTVLTNSFQEFSVPLFCTKIIQNARNDRTCSDVIGNNVVFRSVFKKNYCETLQEIL